MRVVHLSNSDVGGGAARGSYALHRELIRQGVDSQMLVQFAETDDPTVHRDDRRSRVLMHGIRRNLDRSLLKRYPSRTGRLFSVTVVPGDVGGRVRALKPDIVHLHWVARSFARPEDIQGFGVPSIWTLRDMWPFTGGCHYSLDCTRYERACGQCPVLRSGTEPDLSTRLLLRKRKAMEKTSVVPVALSRWLQKTAEGSAVFGGESVELIPNGIDVDFWAPAPRSEAREALGIGDGDLVVLFIALHLEEANKGFADFASACRTLSARGMRFRALVVGEPPSEGMPDLGLPTTHLGQIHDDDEIRSAYAAADVTVVASRQEAFGKTAAESQACGTPVVCYAGTGVADIVEDGITGRHAALGVPESLAESMQWCLADPQRLGVLSEAAREAAERDFSVALQARRYVELYRRTLSSHN